MPITKNNYQGCLIGCAIGDALGKYKENLSLQKAQERYGFQIDCYVEPHSDSNCRELKPEQHTDDTDLILLVGESLIQKGHVDPVDIAEKLVEWYENPMSRKRYRGHSTVEAINSIKEKGFHCWWDTGAAGDGCGASTRIIPIPLAFLGLDHLLSLYSALLSIITHRNQIAIDGAQVVAASLSTILGGNLPDVNALTHLIHSEEFHEKLQLVNPLLERSATIQEAMGHLGSSVSADDVVSLSLFIFLSNPDSFDCVISAANANSDQGGDTDSLACIVGAMFGLMHGIEELPSELIRDIENRERLDKLATGLFEFNQNIYSTGAHAPLSR